MYVGIDVGGTKTLVASLTDAGVIKHSQKFPTPKRYADFLGQLLTAIQTLPEKDFKAGGIGIPGRLDRERGLGERFGNLPWRNVPIKADTAALTGCPMAFENDAKLGALGEAVLEPDYSNILYVAVGTGIGIARVIDGVIDADTGDGGGRGMLIEHNGQLQSWEAFASGHAIYEQFGMKASEITDDAMWQKIAHNLSIGLIDLIALMEPDLVILGGGIGTHYPKYGHHLETMVRDYTRGNPLLTIPPIRSAQRPEEAVVYGAYELARRLYA